ncbi:hypothetical protein BC567DRAFT_300109, partial [Phyllosticta citribraziliensis]
MLIISTTSAASKQNQPRLRPRRRPLVLRFPLAFPAYMARHSDRAGMALRAPLVPLVLHFLHRPIRLSLRRQRSHQSLHPQRSRRSHQSLQPQHFLQPRQNLLPQHFLRPPHVLQPLRSHQTL